MNKIFIASILWMMLGFNTTAFAGPDANMLIIMAATWG